MKSYGCHVKFERGWGGDCIQRLLQKRQYELYIAWNWVFVSGSAPVREDRPFEGVEAFSGWGSSLRDGV